MICSTGDPARQGAECRPSPPSQLLCNGVWERRALAGVRGIKIKLHTFTVFGQRDTAQGVELM